MLTKKGKIREKDWLEVCNEVDFNFPLRHKVHNDILYKLIASRGMEKVSESMNRKFLAGGRTMSA